MKLRKYKIQIQLKIETMSAILNSIIIPRYIFLLLLSIVPVYGFSQSGAKMQLDSEILDMDTICLGAEQSFLQIISNVGVDTLIIKEYLSPCGCIRVSIIDTVIAPGDSSQIVVKYVRLRLGKIAQLVKIFTNESKDNKHVLWIKGYVEECEE
jgi:hypothetical protein